MVIRMKTVSHLIRYQIELPLAPSINEIWGHGRGRVYRSNKYHSWLKECDAIFMQSGLNRGLKTINGKYKLHVLLPDSMRPDSDNVGFKAINDWLQRVKIVSNDKYCKDNHAVCGEAPKGRCIVTVEEM